MTRYNQALYLRVTDDDIAALDAALDAIANRLLTRSAIAREALRLGLEVIAHEPALLVGKHVVKIAEQRHLQSAFGRRVGRKHHGVVIGVESLSQAEIDAARKPKHALIARKRTPRKKKADIDAARKPRKRTRKRSTVKK